MTNILSKKTDLTKDIRCKRFSKIKKYNLFLCFKFHYVMSDDQNVLMKLRAFFVFAASVFIRNINGIQEMKHNRGW